MRRLICLLAVLTACDERGVLSEFPLGTLELRLESPVYGEFVGDGPILVEGTAGTRAATVLVEGQEVELDDDGGFRVFVPVDHAYRIIDVEASLLEDVQEARVPVFEGEDPLLTWPGGLSARLTPSGLQALGAVLASTVDGLLTTDALGNLGGGGLGGGGDGPEIAITSVTAAPTVVDLIPTADGLVAAFAIADVVIELTVTVDVFGNPTDIPVGLTLPLVEAELALETVVDGDGALAIELGEPDITFDSPIFNIGAIGFDWLAPLLDQWLDLDTLLTEQISNLLDGADALSLGEGLAFETDLLGTTLAIRLSDVVTDVDGVGLGLAVGLGEPAAEGPSPVPPPPGDFDPPVDLALAVHEGLLQVLLESDLLDLLDQDIQLPNPFGALLGNLVKQLPGGNQAPDAAGWCVGIQPGDAKVARFTEGDSLLAIYLPDADVSFGRIPTPGAECEDWLVSSLALELAFQVEDGTQLGFDLIAPEGKLVSYGAVGEDEDEVIEELGNTIGGLLGLLGGLANIDLADILGGLGGEGGGLGGIPLDGLSLEIRSAKQVVDPEGEDVEGLYEIGIQLFE